MLSTVTRILRQSRSSLSDTHPHAEQVVSTAVRYYATAHVKSAKLSASLRYDAPIEPTRLYEVSPEQIERTVSWTRISANRKDDEHPRFRQPKYRLAGRVFDGDWDRGTDLFTDSTIYQSFRVHFEQGVPWEETAFYGETRDAIEAGENPWDCQSVSDLDERCQRLDELYERIGTQGYKTQNELHRAGDTATNPHRLYRLIWGEIAVHVGRNGEFIFQDGRNRLALARLCGLESVPVVILVRHSEWQKKRDQVASGELSRTSLLDSLQSHPDLVELF